jgi:hypothetical protein
MGFFIAKRRISAFSQVRVIATTHELGCEYYEDRNTRE